MTRHRLTPLALLAALAAGAGCGEGATEQGAPDQRTGGDRARAGAQSTRPEAAPPAPRPERVQTPTPAVRLEATRGIELEPAAEAELEAAAQRFAVSLTRWLYGERGRLDVEPLAAPARRELESSPPYIPADQQGTGQGRVQALEVALQTPRSGIVTVTINDLRTSYRIPAGFEDRDGRWQIVHLNTH